MPPLTRLQKKRNIKRMKKRKRSQKISISLVARFCMLHNMIFCSNDFDDDSDDIIQEFTDCLLTINKLGMAPITPDYDEPYDTFDILGIWKFVTGKYFKN